MKKHKKLYLIFSLLIMLISISIVTKTFQNDTFSAIKIGDYILKNGLDFDEHFNIQNNLIYHNSRWLFNVIVALIYNCFSYIGIYIFVIILSIALGLAIFNVLIKLNNNIVLSFIITLIVMYDIQPFITARAQLVSYILLLIEVYSIEKISTEPKKINYFILIICSILIANIHTTIWPVTLLLFLPYICEYYLCKTKIIKKSKRLYTNIKNIKMLLISFIIVLFTGLCTPLVLTPYTYMIKTMSGISSKTIAELQPVNVMFDSNFLICTIMYIFLIVYLRNKIKISDVFLILGFYFMSVLAVRNLPFFYVFTSISFARLIKDSLYKIDDKIEILTSKMENATYILIIISFLIITISVCNLIEKQKEKYVDKRLYPVDATKYIKENLDVSSMRLYNHFNFGSYLELNDIKVFLDSRSEVYTKEFNNTSILNDWSDAYYGLKNYKKVFNKYKFTHVLLYRNELISKYICDDKYYKEIYKDKYFILYEKIN